MPKVNTFNYDTIASWNGSEDLFVVEQPDGTKVATPAMVKQYVLAGVTETSEQYAESSTARNVTAKTVTLPGFELETGARISVRFTDTGTSNPASGNLTLNVNGTGAKEIVDSHTNKTKLTYTSGGLFYNNIVNDFIYDGTYWVYMNRDNNTTYSSKTAASGGTATSLCTTGEKYTWNNKQNALTFDNTPTASSNNPVKSGGVKTYVDNAVSPLKTNLKDFKNLFVSDPESTSETYTFSIPTNAIAELTAVLGTNLAQYYIIAAGTTLRIIKHTDDVTGLDVTLDSLTEGVYTYTVTVPAFALSVAYRIR